MNPSSQTANYPSLQLLPASQFSINQLTHIYNQSRKDYLVPMQISASAFASYIHWYDIDLNRSFVAFDGSQTAGMIMLGVRPGRTWFTRLGVLPEQRRHGVGAVLMQALQEQTKLLRATTGILEVIAGNTTAHRLFLSLGFRETRELLVLRRAPGILPFKAGADIRWLNTEQSMDLLRSYPGRLPWTNEPHSMINGGDCLGLQADLGSIGKGWLIFRRQPELLSHLVFHTESGDAQEIAVALCGALYQRFPVLQTCAENIPASDPHLLGLQKIGFKETFRRMEMCWQTGHMQA